MLLENSIANCMLTTNVTEKSWKPTKNETENDKGDQSASVEETKEIPVFTTEELQAAIDTLIKKGKEDTATESERKTSKHATKREEKW